MLTLVLRGFVQRKLRVLLTGVSIALGVALMAGTYILTDTIDHAFSGIFQAANKGHDVVITPAESLGKESTPETSPITAQMLARVREVPGVAEAAGGILSRAAILDTHRKRLTGGHAGGLVAAEVPKRFESFTPVQGRFPASASEVAVDEATAERNHLKLGQQIIVAGAGKTGTYTLVGILRFGGGQSFGGATIALLTAAEAQRVVGADGRFDHIDVAAVSGVTPSELRDRVRAVLPSSVTVRTGAEEAANETSQLESRLSGLRTFLLVFAYVALVVGAFIIFNTFSITIAQRTREFGLLRTLGASRAQIMRGVVYEGLMLGVLGSVLGLLGGIGLAPGLDQLFKTLGADLPDNGTVIETRTIVVSLLVGTLVTLASGLIPAIRATRVPPLAAMREGIGIPPRPLPTKRQLVVRFVAGLVVVLAIGALLHGLGVILLILWVARAVRLSVRLRREGQRPARHYRIVPALARAIGSLFAWRGITAKLAQENSIRQPGRTLTTAAALTVGIALVALVAVLADGLKATIDQAVDSSFAGNLIVESSQSTEAAIPAAVAPALRAVPGVAEVTPVAFTEGRLHGTSKNVAITAIEPATFGRMYRIEWERGSNATLAQLGSTGAIATKEYAKQHHLKLGQTLSLLTPTDRSLSLRLVGIAANKSGLLGGLTISLALAGSAFGQREDAFDFLAYARGLTDAQVQPAVDRMLASRFPQTRSRTAAQFKEDQAKQINTLLTLIYVLLTLSVIVSLFGIVNTLILSVYERTRELGMMRAIGTSRRQIRQMIRYESVITALIGGVFGLVIGVVAAFVITTTTFSGDGYVQAYPVPTLIVLLFVAAFVGLVAAQAPARRAARLDMLAALASD